MRFGMTRLQVAASALGIAGALLTAGAWSMGGGFAAFLASNLAAAVFFARSRMWALLVQQLVFLGTSLLGLWTWWLLPLLLGA